MHYTFIHYKCLLSLILENWVYKCTKECLKRREDIRILCKKEKKIKLREGIIYSYYVNLVLCTSIYKIYNLTY